MDVKERRRLLYMDRLQKLRPIDDDFIRVMLKDNIPLAQMILRIITGIDDLIVTQLETQADLRRVTGARSLCLDALCTDSQNRKLDIEIQRADRGAGAHRARYHSSMMDMEYLDAGQDFEELPDTYTIFITEKDYFKAGKPVYHIERTNTTIGVPFPDGEHILYVNGEYRDDSAIGWLMHDFSCAKADDMHYDLMSERTRYLKEHPEGVSEMCKIVEDIVNDIVREERQEARQEGLREGLREGHQEGLREGLREGHQAGHQEGLREGIQQGIHEGIQETTLMFAKDLIRRGLDSLEEIARLCRLPLEDVRKLAAELNA